MNENNENTFYEKNNKKPKNIFKILGIVAVLGLIAFITVPVIVLTVSFFDKDTPKERIEKTCNIKLPKDTKTTYSQIGKSAFGGHSAQYTVFQFEKEPTKFLTDGHGSASRKFNIGNGSFVATGLDSFYKRLSSEIPIEYKPDLSIAFLYLELQPPDSDSRVEFLYYSDTKTLKCLYWGH